MLSRRATKWIAKCRQYGKQQGKIHEQPRGSIRTRDSPLFAPTPRKAAVNKKPPSFLFIPHALLLDRPHFHRSSDTACSLIFDSIEYKATERRRDETLYVPVILLKTGSNSNRKNRDILTLPANVRDTKINW